MAVRSTGAAVVVAVLLLAAVFNHIEVVPTPIRAIAEVDTIIGAFGIVMAAFLRARRGAKREAKLQAERLGVVKVTMRTVQDPVK